MSEVVSDMGILSRYLQVSTYSLEGDKRRLLVGKWSESAPELTPPNSRELFSDGFSISAPEEFVDFLLLRLQEVEIEKGVFSLEWYLLKVCLFYFSSEKLTANDAFNIGYFYSQVSEKIRMEEDALKAQKAASYRKSGTAVNSLSAPHRRLQKENVIISLRDEIIDKHGLSAVRIDTKAASYIHVLAEQKRPPELWVAAKKRVISESTIRNLLVDLRREGKIS